MAQMSTVSFNNEKKNIRETCLRSKRCENFKQLIFVKCTLPEILEFRKKKKFNLIVPPYPCTDNKYFSNSGEFPCSNWMIIN